jgi:DNA-binding NarL/FixJ family response regulator
MTHTHIDNQLTGENRAVRVGSSSLRALILDDDDWALRLIRYVLEEALPGVSIEERLTPDAEGDFDIYIVDNDFDGARCASRIVPSIRERRPDALIVAFSATLDRTTLKTLLNAGCDAALEKARPNDLEALSDAVRHFARSYRRSSEPRRGVIDSVKAIRDLIHEWNTRLTREEEALDEA